MPKRKAKRPVGRPPKKRPKKDTMSWVETEIGGLVELKELTNYSLIFEIPELPVILDIIEDERKTTCKNLTLYDKRKQSVKYAAWRASTHAFHVKEILQKVREFSDGKDKAVQDWIAGAIELGRLSVAMQVVSKEPEFQEGRKAKLNREVAHKKATKKPKTKQEIKAALAKHSRLNRTAAIEEAAHECGVKKSTFYKWLKEVDIK